MRKNRFLLAFVFLIGIVLSACSGAEDLVDGEINASGTISAVEINISPELGGKVVEVTAAEGGAVLEGDILFRLDDELFQVQYKQAETGVALAEASLDAAQLQLQAALIQVDMMMQSARFQSRQQRQVELQMDLPEAFDLPIWYFDDDEIILAAQHAVETVQEKLDTEREELDEVLKETSNQDFLSVERQLAEAQAVYLAALLAMEQTQSVNGEKEQLVSAAQKTLDAADAALESRQLEYDRILTTTSAENVLEARARAAAAQLMLDNAQDQLDNLQTGENSLPVEASQIAVSQAGAAVAQAEAGLAQAEAALELLDLQINKSVVKAPTSGTILSVNLDAGEVVGPGSVSMVLAQLDEVTLTVFVPEDQYGRVSIGQEVSVTVDSFSGRVFTGVVRYIADQAEFTPRNVQTTESRKTTVYAVKIGLMNPDRALKPGMSADVIFEK